MGNESQSNINEEFKKLVEDVLKKNNKEMKEFEEKIDNNSINSNNNAYIIRKK